MLHAIRLLLVVFLLVSVADKAKSCSCSDNTNDIKSQVMEHNLIFYGKLVHLKISKRTQNGRIMSILTYKFVADKFWRGEQVDTVSIEEENSLCSRRLNVGSVYIIYAVKNQGLSTCSRLGTGIEHESERLDKLFTRKRFKQLQAAG